MLIQALFRYSQSLGLKDGWSDTAVAGIIDLDRHGRLLGIVPYGNIEARGRSTFMLTPLHHGRTSQIRPYFLADTAAYLLGLLPDRQKGRRRFEASRDLHRKVLKDLNSPSARAILAFFASWDPNQAESKAVLTDLSARLRAGNLVFRIDHGSFAHDDPSIAEAWNRFYDESSASKDSRTELCLITGQSGPVEATHPKIFGFPGCASGCSLITCNAEAYSSYGRTQNFNAPVTRKVAFGYTSALCALLQDREHVLRLGDIVLVFWAEGGKRAYQDLFMGALLESAPIGSDADLKVLLRKLIRGESTDTFETAVPFFVLGLSACKGRLAVRFFLQSTFGPLLERLLKHRERLTFETLTPPSIREILRLCSQKDAPTPSLSNGLLRALFFDEPYPAELLPKLMSRFRAQNDDVICNGHSTFRSNELRAAVLKAYFLRNSHPDIPEEILTVSLNTDSRHPPYVLGRLFSILEAIQWQANPSVQRTVKDRFLNAAMSMPATTFPRLLTLSNSHLRKLPRSKHVYFSRLCDNILDHLEGDLPKRLSLAEQGAFLLGYAHQNAARFNRKKEADHDSNA